MRDIKESSGIPLYFQLKQIVQDKILSGEFAPDEKIPPEAQLCNEYGVSRITVRKAIDLLVKDNMLYTKQGVGTFVSPHKLIRELTKIYSFSDDMIKLGFQPSSRAIEFGIETAAPEDAKILRLPSDDLCVYRIIRIRMADNEPIMIENTLVPHYLCGDLQQFDIEKDSLYRILSDSFQLTPYEADETYEAAMIQPEEADLLKCKRNLAVFHIHRVGYLADGRVFELTKSTGRGDLLQFKLHLATNEANFSKHVWFKNKI
ncbi:MAG: GntR family transcriptional regulator [Spirochaetales bacterium]|nr:GntR family transcriptional regulator [Spirochaetales bacterium]